MSAVHGDVSFIWRDHAVQWGVCPWPFSFTSHGEVGVFSLGLMAMQS